MISRTHTDWHGGQFLGNNIRFSQNHLPSRGIVLWLWDRLPGHFIPAKAPEFFPQRKPQLSGSDSISKLNRTPSPWRTTSSTWSDLVRPATTSLTMALFVSHAPSSCLRLGHDGAMKTTWWSRSCLRPPMAPRALFEGRLWSSCKAEVFWSVLLNHGSVALVCAKLGMQPYATLLSSMLLFLLVTIDL